MRHAEKYRKVPKSVENSGFSVSGGVKTVSLVLRFEGTKRRVLTFHTRKHEKSLIYVISAKLTDVLTCGFRVFSSVLPWWHEPAGFTLFFGNINGIFRKSPL